MLSSLSLIYVPFRLAAPVMLEKRRITQTLCHQNLHWDEQNPENIVRQCAAWKSNLLILEDIKVERCFKPTKSGKIKNAVCINFFLDLTEYGYGQCSYLRMVDKNDQIYCSLVIGKSRVVPLKYISIRQLVLTAATFSIKMSKLLMSELQFGITKEVFSTDSQVVLSYIKNQTRRSKTFVINRIQTIKGSL